MGSPDEMSVFIRKSPDDDDLAEFLSAREIRASDAHGPINGPLEEMLSHPAPYVFATATASALAAAFHAYAKHRKRQLVIRQTKKGTTLEIHNYTPEEIKQMDVLDVLEFRNAEHNQKNGRTKR